MTKVERYIWLALTACVAILFARFYVDTTLIRHLDSVFLFESIDSILRGGGPESPTVSYWPIVLSIISAPVDELCAKSFEFLSHAGYNVLDNHAYFALYPIALIAALFETETAFAVLNSLAHVVLAFMPYVFLRRAGVGPVSAAAFVVCILVYPGWSNSALGDYYLDRMYMPLMLGLLYVLNQKAVGQDTSIIGNYDRFVFVVLAIFAASLTERAAVMVIATLLFYLTVYSEVRRNVQLRWLVIGLALFLVGYLIFYFKIKYNGFGGGGSLIGNALLTPNALWQRLQHPGLLSFVLTNFIFLGWVAIFSGWRILLLSFGACLPNLLITVGGAELTGWATHYHAMYIPFLVFAASLGYVNLIERLKGSAWQNAVSISIATSAVAFAGLASQFGLLGGSARGWDGFGIARVVFDYFVQPEKSGERARVEWARKLQAALPLGVRVSAIEGVMPALYRGRSLAMYPYGMDNADYLAISGSTRNGEIDNVGGAVSYRGPKEEKKLNLCLSERARKQGFELGHDFSAIGILVFKRKEIL